MTLPAPGGRSALVVEWTIVNFKKTRDKDGASRGVFYDSVFQGLSRQWGNDKRQGGTQFLLVSLLSRC